MLSLSISLLRGEQEQRSKERKAKSYQVLGPYFSASDSSQSTHISVPQRVQNRSISVVAHRDPTASDGSLIVSCKISRLWLAIPDWVMPYATIFPC